MVYLTSKLVYCNNDELSIKKLNKLEDKRQLETKNLIASENYTSPAVREAGSLRLTNKYSEDYACARYYRGNENVYKEVKNLAIRFPIP